MALVAAALILAAAAPPGASMKAAAAAPFPTGTFAKQSGGGPGCPPGFDCSNFKVTCPNVDEAITGDLAVRSASSARGLVMFFQDAGGGQFVPQSSPAIAMMDDLHAAHFQIVQVRWDSAWFHSASGESAGFGRLGCRPATVIKWVENNLYNEKSHSIGACGFCLVGLSGGAAAISYALSHYGLDSIVDAAIPIGGPPYAALVKGCLLGYQGYTFAPHTAQNADKAYGFDDPGGPCDQRDESWTDRWTADAVDTGAHDLAHPATRFVFIFGGEDNTVGPPHGRDYADALVKAGSKMVSVEEPAGVEHEPWQSETGLAILKAAIMGQGVAGDHVPGSGSGPSPSSSGGRGGRGGRGSTPTPTPTLTATAPTPTASPSAPPIALPPTAPGGKPPWSLMLLALAPIVAVVAYRLLRKQPLWPRRTPSPPPPA
jgi:hypothetical protein